MEQREDKQRLHRQIEILREKLHRQKDITNHDALILSIQLDQLILESMKSREH